jgi:hypothetical protein
MYTKSTEVLNSSLNSLIICSSFIHKILKWFCDLFCLPPLIKLDLKDHRYTYTYIMNLFLLTLYFLSIVCASPELVPIDDHVIHKFKFNLDNGTSSTCSTCGCGVGRFVCFIGIVFVVLFISTVLSSFV